MYVPKGCVLRCVSAATAASTTLQRVVAGAGWQRLAATRDTLYHKSVRHMTTTTATPTHNSNTSSPSAVISVLELFSIGIGPSSSHTVGPMRAAERFASLALASPVVAESVASVSCKLYGSLALTGIGHGTPDAIMHGLEGHLPDTVPIDSYLERVAEIKSAQRIRLGGSKEVHFDESCLPLLKDQVLPKHSNGMQFFAYDAEGNVLLTRRYYSIGGGFFVTDEGHDTGDALAGAGALAATTSHSTATAEPPFPFSSARQLLDMCKEQGCTIADLAMRNELVWHSQEDVVAQLLRLWEVMDACIARGTTTTGMLRGGLKVHRRAPGLARALATRVEVKAGAGAGTGAGTGASEAGGAARRHLPHLHGLEYDAVSLWAIAVNEENAAGGRVVTAPTNGAAGIIPATLKYFLEFVLPEQLQGTGAHTGAEGGGGAGGGEGQGVADADMLDGQLAAREAGIARFLLTAGVIGMLFKSGASISAAEVGCQGEVGVACSMAAAALAAVQGGTLEQIESAAEIAMEHNLGLTCDPIGGLVQVPCIERNSIGAVKAIVCARLALSNNFEPQEGGYQPIVSLDNVIATMFATGRDMQSRYKETSLGGLAANVPVSVPEC